MKNLFFSLAFMLISSFAFANAKEVKKETSKQSTSQTTKVTRQQQWTYRCSDGVVVQFECGCNQEQATAMGRAWCNNR